MMILATYPPDDQSSGSVLKRPHMTARIGKRKALAAKSADDQVRNNPNGKCKEHKKFPYLARKWHILMFGRLAYFPFKLIGIHCSYSFVECKHPIMEGLSTISLYSL